MNKKKAPAKRAAPSIVAFCCENSAIKAAEALAGNPVLKNVDMVKVPCAGRVEIHHVMKRLENGARGVLVLGCPLDNCKYIAGNRRTLKRVDKTRKVLEDAGLDGNRVRMGFLSSVDSHKLLDMLKEMKSL